MKTKYLLLFEDYSKELEANLSETGHTWSQVRDAIQMKRPFVIINFKDKQSYLDALSSVLSNYDYIKQSAIISVNGKPFTLPSVFFVLDKDTTFEPTIKKLYQDFNIDSIIAGKSNSEYSTLYSEDGTSQDYGNEIMSTLSPDEFNTENYFKIGSTYYRFIDFTQ